MPIGYFILLDRTPISFETLKLSLVVESTCEAEYLAVGDYLKEMQYILIALHDIFTLESPRMALFDNQPAITVNNQTRGRAPRKHLDIKKKEWVKCSTKQNIADGKKILPAALLTSHRNKLYYEVMLFIHVVSLLPTRILTLRGNVVKYERNMTECIR